MLRHTDDSAFRKVLTIASLEIKKLSELHYLAKYYTVSWQFQPITFKTGFINCSEECLVPTSGTQSINAIKT